MELTVVERGRAHGVARRRHLDLAEYSHTRLQTVLIMEEAGQNINVGLSAAKPQPNLDEVRAGMQVRVQIQVFERSGNVMAFAAGIVTVGSFLPSLGRGWCISLPGWWIAR